MVGSDPSVDDTDDDVLPRLLLPPRTPPQGIRKVQEVGRVSGVREAVGVGDHRGNLGVGSEEDGFGWGEGGCKGIQGVLVAAGWGKGWWIRDGLACGDDVIASGLGTLS